MGLKLKDYFVFDGESSADFGFFASGENVYNSPEKDYDTYEIPGRNGDITISNNRFKNVTVTYPCYYEKAGGDLTRDISDFQNMLLSKDGYKRLYDTHNPNEYRIAVCKGMIEMDPTEYEVLAAVEIEFDCKPQRFLTSGETTTTFTSAGSITNPTLFEAKPLLKVTGYGTLGVGDRSVIITGTAGQVIYIDCKIMEAWQMNGTAIIPRNDYVQYVGEKFPVLASGTNGISMSGNITKVEVTPRWWRL